MPSVRVTGGDTIIRYATGELVVKRSNRRAVWRKRVILTYVGCYAAAFALYLYYILTGTFSVTPAEYFSKAFAKRRGENVQDLEQAAMAVMRGNRTPAEVRMAQELVFHDEHNDTIRIQAGDRLTLLTAAKLGQAIIRDNERGESKRVFDKPFRLYRETYLTNMDWPFWLAVLNAFGFFLVLGLFLWRPGRNYLGAQGKKTAASLREARLALEKSDAIREGYRRLSSDIEERGENMRDAVLRQAAKDQKKTLQEAGRKAGSIKGEIGSLLDREEIRAASKLGADAANVACRMAGSILEKRLGRTEHDLAIEELIADIAAYRAAAPA
jgi:F0F1-type ATP synthase membrane subunit b/b'